MDFPIEKLIKTNFSNHFTEPEKAREGYLQVFKKGFVTDYPLTIKDGKLTDVLVNGSVYEDEQGNVLGAVVVARDVSEQKGIEKELIEAKSKAELATEKANESNKLKEAFLANMSHEIRTPMNAIIGFSDLLFKRKLEEKEKEYVTIIKSAGENLLTIINDILDISKIEAGMMTFEEHVFSVKQIFKSLSIMMMVKAKEKNIELVFSCDEDVPDVLLGDNTRLTQIIINQAGNAIKFTQKGKVIVHAKILKKENENSLVKFSIKDTGIGIAPDKLDRIFERFHQAESNTTRKYGGTGLGLSIAKKLVELQGGTLSVKSELNEGSEFSFCISYKKASDVYEESKIVEKEKKYNMEELSKLNILLVEDNQLNIKLILSLFSENNLKVQVVENGSEGIKKIKGNNFDIILMDMEMPVMNGYEATTYIRKELKNTIPIIAMTAHAMAGEKERCLSLGMNDYISKPINANMLFNKIYSLTVKPW
jgi:signal transduction histidine kinase/CheY-like chemotaxis protein